MGAIFSVSAQYNDHLPSDCQICLNRDQTRYLEYEFHSAGYHALVNIVKGLEIAVDLLIKVCSFRMDCDCISVFFYYVS